MQSSIINPSNCMPNQKTSLQNMKSVLMENIGVSSEELAVMTDQDVEEIYHQYMNALGEQNQQNCAHQQQKCVHMNESDKNSLVQVCVQKLGSVKLKENTSQLHDNQKQRETSQIEEQIWINEEKYHKPKCFKNQAFIRSSNRLNMICQSHPLTLQQKRQTVLKIFTPDMAQTIKDMTEFELSEIMLSMKQLHTKQNLFVDWVPCKQQKGKKFFVYFATKEEHDVHKSQQNISKTKKKPIEKKVFYDDADFFNERQAQPIQKAPSEEHKTQSPKKSLFSAKFKKSIETQTDQEQLTKPKQSQKIAQQPRRPTKVSYYKKTYIIDSQQQNPTSINIRQRPADNFFGQLSNECYKIDINALVKSIATASDNPNPKVIAWIGKLKCFSDKLLNLYMKKFEEC